VNDESARGHAACILGGINSDHYAHATIGGKREEVLVIPTKALRELLTDYFKHDVYDFEVMSSHSFGVFTVALLQRIGHFEAHFTGGELDEAERVYSRYGIKGSFNRATGEASIGY
jgi:hypothetical protein